MKKLFRYKKAAFSLFSDWGEFFFFVLLFVGLVIGALSPSAFITYMLALFLGMMAGRLLFERKNKMKAPYVLIVIGFVLGYIIGTFHGDKKITFLLFVFGAALLYFLLDRKIIKDTFI